MNGTFILCARSSGDDSAENSKLLVIAMRLGYSLGAAQSAILKKFIKVNIFALSYNRMEQRTKKLIKSPSKKAQRRRNRPRRPKMKMRLSRRREILKITQKRPRRK